MALSVDIMTSTQGSLLALPLEIRFMIYDLIMLSQPGRGKLRSYHCGKGRQIQRSGYRPGCRECDVCDGDQGLFLVNRQIYFEMEHLLHNSPVRLTIFESLSYSSFERGMPVEKLLGKCNWAQPNTKEVRLQLTSPSLRVMRDDNKGISEVDSNKKQDVEKAFDQMEAHAMISEFWRAFFCLCYYLSQSPPPQPQISLQPITKLLSTFPSLETVELLWPQHSSAVNTWPSFWDDLKALTTSKPTCSMKIIVSNENTIIDLFWFLQEHGGRLLMTSTWQYGEHSFCEDDVESKTWRRSGLDTGVRWENTWRIVEQRCGGGLSVDVLLRESREETD